MQGNAPSVAVLPPLPLGLSLKEPAFRPVERGASVTWTDEELGAAVGAGNILAETELFVRFRPRVERMVQQVLHATPDAEDVTALVLEAALSSLRLGRFRGECRLSTFIHAVARNKIGEHLRRRRPPATELTEQLGVPDPGPLPDACIGHAELSEAVRHALEELPPKYREVLRLYYYEGLAVHEIAARLGVPPRQVTEWKDYGLRVIRTRYGRRLEEYR